MYAMRTTSGTFAANKINHHNCNRYLNGNYEVYRKKMVKELGQEKVDELERKAKSGQKMSIGELESLLETLEMEISHKSE